MALAGLIPALLAERVERAFVIGWGTGVTAGELSALDSVREVVVAEISSGVLAAAPLFDFASLGASRHPKIRVIQSDAYRALLRSPQRFDVIVSEPSNPWMTGVEMLYSREFLAAAKQHLAPGGVYAQWYHQYETDYASLSLVLRTYAAVFDHVAVWYGAGADLFLLGFDAPESALDLARFERRAAQPEFGAAFARSGVAGVAGLLAHELLPLGVVHALRFEGPIHTLTHPLLSFQAARAFFAGRSAALPFSGFGEAARVGAAHSLLGRYLGDAAPAERARRLREAALEACRHRGSSCVALLAGWRHFDPAAPPLDELVQGPMRESLFGGGVDPVKIEAVAALLGPPDAGPLTLEQTRQRTDLFRVFHHHALPFDAARVVDLWERCSDDAADPGACARGRELLARLLAEAAGTS
jgi:hypothetical protein